MVKAGVLTAGLLGVAHKILLLVFPHLLSCCHIHQDPEQEDHRKPNAPNHGGVLVYSTEDVLQKAPIHLRPSFC
uniref:Secreted protein n=1 Tax=Mastacembelus armatus TaxID=205130 RepID=A0A7N9AVU0_9TELE